MKRVAVSYARCFNARYDRAGYLFQGRFGSEAVETDGYLLALFRYIHQSPALAGESTGSLTSFDEYVGSPGLVDADLVLQLFSDDPAEARTLFSEFVSEAAAGDQLESLGSKRSNIWDTDAIKRVGESAPRWLSKDCRGSSTMGAPPASAPRGCRSGSSRGSWE